MFHFVAETGNFIRTLDWVCRTDEIPSGPSKVVSRYRSRYVTRDGARERAPRSCETYRVVAAFDRAQLEIGVIGGWHA